MENLKRNGRMKLKPYMWQLQAAVTGAAAKIIALVVDCGGGKTLAAILIALIKKLPVIVIAPTHRLCEQWKNDILDIMDDDADVWVYSKPDETKQGDQYRKRFEEWLTA